MSLSVSLIFGFLFHLIGDYIFQNDWMAVNKTKSFLPAFIHATIYSLPFLILVSWEYWLIIYVTHFLIDRYRLAVYWIKLVNWNFSSKNFGYDENKPMWMSVWLMIIVDNVFHIIINSLSIYLNWTVLH